MLGVFFKGVEKDIWDTAGVVGSDAEYCLRFLARVSRGVVSRRRLRDIVVERFKPSLNRLIRSAVSFYKTRGQVNAVT